MVMKLLKNMAFGKAAGWRSSGLAAAIRLIPVGMIRFHKK
jgi:hypothetical protein